MAAIKENWFILESDLDPEQIKIRRLSLNQSYIVKGCAGSGKTVLALWRAVEIANKGETCIVIVFQGTLKAFIRAAEKAHPIIATQNVHIYTDWEWRVRGMPEADHFIIDEAQDFSKDEIDEYRTHAKKTIALYGDSAQRLYPKKAKYNEENQKVGESITLSIEEIADHLDLPIRPLRQNHRLPRRIARFAQPLNIGNDKLEALCTKEGERNPGIIRCASFEQELDTIASIIQSRGFQDVGIFVPHNEQARQVYDYLVSIGITAEVRWRAEGSRPFDTLDFETDNPKIITYHSAKGLQFQSVFMPMCNQNTSIKQVPMYVGCTRASRELYITYSGRMHPLLNNILRESYDLTDLTQQTTSRTF